MIFRPSIVFWMLFLACGFVGLYTIKYRVQAVKAEVAAAERQLMEEKKNLHVLEAEWAYLARPERLTTLSQKYLTLAPLGGKQMVDYVQLPVDSQAVMHLAAEKSLHAPAGRTGIALASGAGHAR